MEGVEGPNCHDMIEVLFCMRCGGCSCSCSSCRGGGGSGGGEFEALRG